MEKRPNAYPLRLSWEVLEKTRIIAAVNNRSINREIEYRLKQVIADYEKQHGMIPISQESNCE